jgi:hypothetical protein
MHGFTIKNPVRFQQVERIVLGISQEWQNDIGKMKETFHKGKIRI